MGSIGVVRRRYRLWSLDARDRAGCPGVSLPRGLCPCLLPTAEHGHLLLSSLETSKDGIDCRYHNALNRYFLSLKKTRALFISKPKKIGVQFISIMQTAGSIMSDENLFCHTCLSLNSSGGAQRSENLVHHKVPGNTHCVLS